MSDIICMKFRDFIMAERAKGKTDTKIAADLTVSRSYMLDILAGRKSASFAFAQRVHAKTKGVVPLTSWPVKDTA